MLDLVPAAHGRSRERAWRILAGILIAAVIVSGLPYVVFEVGVQARLEHILILPSSLIVRLVFLLPAATRSATGENARAFGRHTGAKGVVLGRVVEASPHGGPLARPDTSSSAEPA
ncbi:MAG: hypothetical protein ACXV5Q_04895 [Frankiaceae bacterium]